MSKTKQVRVQEEAYRRAAKLLHAEAGVLEFDEKPRVSLAHLHNGGSWVQAWVWVSDADAGLSDGEG